MTLVSIYYLFDEAKVHLVINESWLNFTIHEIEVTHVFYHVQEQAEPKPHLFPFMVEGDCSSLSNLYRRVRTTMLKIDDGNCSIDDLISIAHER